MSPSQILWFEETGIKDVPAVGGKNASLGEMTAALAQKGVKVPSGFATTASTYRTFLLENQLEATIKGHLDDFHAGKATLQETGNAIRSLFLESSFPTRIADEIGSAYKELSRRLGVDRPAVAVPRRAGQA